MHTLQTQVPSTLIMLALAGLLFYFMIIRPARKQMANQRAQRQEVNAGTEVGARVMLASGLIGTVRVVGERQIILELAPGIEVTVLKDAVSRILAPEDEDFDYDDGDDELEVVGAVEGDEPVVHGYEQVHGEQLHEEQVFGRDSIGADDDQFAPVISNEPAEPTEPPSDPAPRA
ncbi:preprotein translocase subunit YajC [Aestuariimicrobium ganziense]|uniref:preprotein translocase subunit YajC n=1 Tax=Aestuariimicrobium ganziense TaxID=2773677 RepID=UPI001941BC43|nr:preprotein translocase subunit YajC [Aestuariimicrobium ganziense]